MIIADIIMIYNLYLKPKIFEFQKLAYTFEDTVQYHVLSMDE